MAGARFVVVLGTAALLALLVLPASGEFEVIPQEPLETTSYYIAHRPNYAGADWVFSQTNNRIIGYAPWDSVQRRWTLFTLTGKYAGFVQATIGEATYPIHYKQYLKYDKDNRYKGVLIARLGGRPLTKDRPYGELGGSLDLYEVGNIPTTPPSYQLQIDPLLRFPEGVDFIPLEPPYGR
jgi:hypothetical protein